MASLEAQLADLRKAAASQTPPSVRNNLKAKEAALQQQAAQIVEEQQALQLEKYALQQRCAVLGICICVGMSACTSQGSVVGCSRGKAYQGQGAPC